MLTKKQAEKQANRRRDERIYPGRGPIGTRKRDIRTAITTPSSRRPRGESYKEHRSTTHRHLHREVGVWLFA
eukprot:1192601-Prorocentrum_minimum.AAC.3